ncbi:hypothetical protein AURDEDRAFT_147691 [Auricularia subglabra TFB-10046 SS5]|nr:hypothetical protein AURDEDRAFT_147691 [Auricularia subglabra TFB-10046 SS5]
MPAALLPTPPMEPAAARPFLFGDEHAQRPSPRVIAEQTAEMICYLWFSNTVASPSPRPQDRSPARRGSQRRPAASQPQTTGPQPQASRPPRASQDPARMALQFQPSATFVDFLLKILDTTQVSQSVIVLALHYVWKLKKQNTLTHGQAGSELRVAVVALMLANKFVDDNTYTNKTWCEVSGIDLGEINRMEREFLTGINYRLFVDEATYSTWLNLLKGLVAAKDKEYRAWQREQARQQKRERELAVSYTHARVPTPRARSSSPTPSVRSPAYPFTFVAQVDSNPFYHHLPPPAPAYQQQPSYSTYEPSYTSTTDSPPPIRKRPAIQAFSPTTYASHTRLQPLKRPVSMDMSQYAPQAGTSFAQWREREPSDVEMDVAPQPHPAPLQPSHPERPRVLTQFTPPQLTHQQYEQPPLSAGGVDASFSRMTLAQRSSPPQYQDVNQDPAQVLAAPCHPDPRSASEAPHALYYYKLACSPLATDDEPAHRDRKGRLRYHQPTQYLHPSVPVQQPLSPVYSGVQQQHQQHQPQPYYPSPAPARYAYKMPLSANASPLATSQALPAHSSSYLVQHQQPTPSYQPHAVRYPPPAQHGSYTPPATVQHQAQSVRLPQLHIPTPRQQAQAQPPRAYPTRQQQQPPVLTPPPSGSSASAPQPFLHGHAHQAPPVQQAQTSPFANAGPPGVRMHWATHPAAPGSGHHPYPPHLQQQYEAYEHQHQQQQYAYPEFDPRLSRMQRV